MTSKIEALVQQLDDTTGASNDARAKLIYMGSDATPAITAGLPSLDGFSQLTTIEVFEQLADAQRGPALIGLLDSEHPAVREWSAIALG
ncbi:hypothetical protein ACIGXA_03360 [Streptomyces fildesensis]|uniref:HEAT repeat domain-containing protein n=1 Tax=Streptomyces fildesensis TaxID=375757 RepID=A0ABW8C0Y0_9ACTN